MSAQPADRVPGIHFLSGLVLGLTAPSALWLLAALMALSHPVLQVSALRAPLALGAGVGWLRSRATPTGDAPPLPWDRPHSPPTGAPHRIRGWLRGRLACLPPHQGELAGALVLGARLSPARRDRWARAGVAHLASQSGLHVGLAFAGVLVLLGRGRAARGAGLLVALGYALLAGWRPAARRAVLFLGLAEVVRRLGLRAHPLGAAAAVTAGMLLAQPELLRDVGAGLSLGATLGLLHLGPALTGALRSRLGDRLAPALGASLGAFLGTLPLMLVAFDEVPLAAPLVNLVAVPLGGILVGLGLVLVGAAALHPGLAMLVAVPFGALGWVLETLVALCARGPAVPVGGTPPALALLLAVLLWHLGENRTGPRGAGPRRQDEQA